MPVMPEGPLRAASAHDQAVGCAGDHALQVGSSGRGTIALSCSLCDAVRGTIRKSRSLTYKLDPEPGLRLCDAPQHSRRENAYENTVTRSTYR
jgi:hypothetical protein